jgi:radical SAM superfamily enzyme YgiQ (UPF0313 family)
MKLALIRGPLRFLVQPNAYEPLGLGYLSAYVHKHAPWVEVDIVDMASGEKPGLYDIYAWTATSLEYEEVKNLAKFYAAKYPEGKHILGGTHATTCWAFIDPIFESVFIGEGEQSLVQYLKDYNLGRPRKLYFGDNICDLDSLPFPERKAPRPVSITGGSHLCVSIMASRGCPFRCHFCASSFMWGKPRYRSPANVLAEIEECIDRFGMVDVGLEDDNHTHRREWLLELAAGMKRLGVEWRVHSRVDGFDEDLGQTLRESGCIEALFGVESFDPVVLKAIGKHTNPEQAKYSIRVAAAAGLNVRVCILMSTPGETPATVGLNCRALDELNGAVKLISLMTLMPLPGTPIFNNPRSHGVRIIEPDMSKYQRYQWGPEGPMPFWSPIEIDGMTRKEQLKNLEDMRTYVGSLEGANKG